MGRVVVLGSVNVDVVVRVAHLPAAGETVLASGQQLFPGGKGANQAVAAARYGADVTFVGCVGDDEHGRAMRDNLVAAGVDVTHLGTVDGPTGTAYIAVDDDGQNSIVVVPGANAEVRDVPALDGFAVAVAQLEVPLATVTAFAERARAAGVPFVLNAAPAQALKQDLLDLVTVLVVNETEAAAQTGEASTVVTTLGGSGARWTSPDGGGEVEAPAVTAVDTTGAGDAFVAALAASLARGEDLAEAVGKGVAAGSRQVTVAGAQVPPSGAPGR